MLPGLLRICHKKENCFVSSVKNFLFLKDVKKTFFSKKSVILVHILLLELYALVELPCKMIQYY